MAEQEQPFEDVRDVPGGVSIPDLKWRELLFVGALVRDGDAYVRDPARPLPPFRRVDLFPEGVHFEVTRVGERVEVRRRS
jgi:hypothetical protein